MGLPRENRFIGVKKSGKILFDIQSVGTGGGGKGIDHGACLCAFDGVGKEPVLASYNKGPNCVFGAVVVNGNVAVFQKTLKIFLFVFGVLYRFGEFGFSRWCDAFKP